MVVKNSFIVALLLIALAGCKDTGKFENQELLTKNEEDGFLRQKIINDVHIDLLLKPTELMIDQDLVNNNLDETKRDSLKLKYKKFIYFVLSYSKDNKEILSTISSSREDFNSIQNTLTFGMKEKVALVNDKNDTIKLIDYHFPRTYGMARSTSMLFIFERDKILEKSKEIYFNVEDIGIGIGNIKFKYPAKTIQDN